MKAFYLFHDDWYQSSRRIYLPRNIRFRMLHIGKPFSWISHVMMQHQSHVDGTRHVIDVLRQLERGEQPRVQ